MAHGQADWWNQPVGGGQQTQDAGTAPAATPPPDPVAQMRQVAREEHVQVAQQYAQYAEKRKAEYQAATEKFLADPQLAPYWEMARSHFTNLDSATQGQTPVAQLFDLTVRQMHEYKKQGIAPPQKAAPRGGFPGTGQNYETPNYDGNFTDQPRFKSEDPVEKLARNQDYILRRRVDLELRKDRSTPEDQIIDGRLASLSQNTIVKQ